MARVYIETYGCTLNQADSDAIAGQLLRNGHLIVKNQKEAEVVVLNTCTVKGATESKIANRIRVIIGSKTPLVIAGCMSANIKRLKLIAPNASIVGTGAISHIGDAVNHVLEHTPAIFDKIEDKSELERIFTAPILRIPISEGCVNACYFCQTKIARPKLMSYRPRKIIDWIKHGLEKGAKEVQITSMDSGAYGMDIKTNFVQLLEQVNEIDGNFLVRIGMINPQHVKRLGPSLIECLKMKKFYKFIHVPVQTGSEKVCKEMNRGHTVKDFYEIVSQYKKEIPEILLSTDIIVGYPTETKEDFEETLKLIESCRIDVVNLSKFSARPGTKAKEMRKLQSQEVKKRSEIANKLIKEVSAEINEKFVGKQYEVLITERQRDFTGRNINYKQVVVKNFKGKIGDKINVEITDSNYGALFGKII